MILGNISANFIYCHGKLLLIYKLMQMLCFNTDGHIKLNLVAKRVPSGEMGMRFELKYQSLN